MDVDTKMARAKTQLILKYPFWGVLACNTPFVKDDSIPTMCTNGIVVRYNPDFVDSIKDTEVIFVIAHEISHIFLKHCTPIKKIDGKPIDQKLQNIAMDYVINPMLIDGGLTDMPEGGLLDTKYSGWTWVKVYRELLQQSDEQESQSWGGNVQTPTDDEGNDLSDAEIKQLNADIDTRVMQAAEVARSKGKLPHGVADLVTEMRRSKVDWIEVFHRFIGGDQPDDYTWSRPQRNAWFNQGIYMPSVERNGVGDIVVAIDTSGSVSGIELEQFLGELNNITEDYNPNSVTVITCDADIQNVVTYEQGDIIDKVDCKGRGGTRVEPVFKYITDNNIEPDNFIYLTDMGIWDFPDNNPDYPVLWVSTDTGCKDAPFGETVRIEVGA